MVRQIWVVEIMQYSFSMETKTFETKQISLFGTIHDRFIKYLMEYQAHHFNYTCSIGCPNTNIRTTIPDRMLVFRKNGDIVEIDTGKIKKCKQCKQTVKKEFRFVYNPTIMMIETGIASLKLRDLPRVIKIQEFKFRFLCTTLHTPGHFLGVFSIKGDDYICDDLKKSMVYLPPLELLERRDSATLYHKLETSASFYVLENVIV